MKILYVSNMRFPSERAYSRQIVEMCRAFADLGHEVSLCVNTRRTHITKTPEEYYGFAFSFALKRIWVPDVMKYGTIGFILTTLVFCFNSVRVVRSEKPGVVYCRSEWILAFLEIFNPSQQKIYESHEAKLSMPVRFLMKRKVPFVVISEGIRDFYLKAGVPKEQILVAHDAVDDSFFADVESKSTARQRLGLSGNSLIAMYIGGFDVWKGIETFFKASDYVSDVEFVAIGGSQSEVDSFKGAYPNVRFLGQHPYTELKDNQQAADVLIIPNTSKNDLSALYTSPLKLFAHLTSRVPLVVSDLPSLRNVVSDEEVLFAKEDDPKALADAIKEVLAHQEEANRRAENAYVMSKQYTWEKRVEMIMRFITT